MYLQYYGLKDYPFSVTPDPAYLFLGAPHREALGHLLYGAGEHGGFVQLTGEVGTGKTTLIRALLETDLPQLDVALCWNPQLDVLEFVATVCDELGVSYDRSHDTSLKALVDRLNIHLLQSHAAGRHTLLIIDEAQNLSRDVLEQLRLLTNLETSKHKLMRIILVGQPELDAFLARHDLRQLTQRISARSTLTPLSRHETSDYISHRLACAGGSGRLFTPRARQLVYWYTRGTPRLINLVCERALMGGYARSQALIGPLVVHRAAREVLPKRRRRGFRGLLWPGAAVAAVLMVFAVAGLSGVRPGDVLATMAGGDNGIVSQADAAVIAPPDSNNTAGAAATADVPTHDGAAATASGDTFALTVPTQPLLLTSASQLPHGEAARPVRVAVAPAAGKKGAANGASGDTRVVLPTGPVTPLPAGDAGLSQLLRQWGVFGANVEASCDNLQVGDLRCFSGHGTLAVLGRFNRPALLLLEHDGRRQHVMLSQLDKDSATLIGAEDIRRIDRERLERLWTGAFQMIWRADAGVLYIRSGTIGGSVVWLRRRLTAAQGKNPDVQLGPESPIFDPELESRLRNFQLLNGLKPDGIAGPRTQILLNGASPDPGTPTLQPKPVEKG